MEDAISKNLLIPRADVATFLDHLGILVNVLAPRDNITGTDVFQVENPPMLETAVAKAKCTLVLSLVVAHMRSLMMRGMYRGNILFGL